MHPVSRGFEMSEQRRLIEETRRLLNTEPVRLRHVPGWLARNIRPHLKNCSVARRSGNSAGAIFRDFLGLRQEPCVSPGCWCHVVFGTRAAFDCLFDHWGTSRGGTVFVSEPYGPVHRNAELFAELLGLTLRVNPNSHWYPGSTFRFEWVSCPASCPHPPATQPPLHVPASCPPLKRGDGDTSESMVSRGHAGTHGDTSAIDEWEGVSDA
jgi:hypothetical protein